VSEYKRIVPQNDLDFNYIVTDTRWGKPDMSAEFKEYLSDKKKVIIPKGARYLDPKTGEEKESDGTVLAYETEYLWERLQFLSQDLRLGNLNPLLGETAYCQYYVNLANDLLQEGYKHSFIIAITRVATVIELSQSNRGFLRKNLTTFRHKQTVTQNEPPKRTIFGGKSKGGE